MGYDFHRQKPISRFICDFYCCELKLAIELDGITHEQEEVIQKDKIKEQELNKRNITVLRFKDEEVFNDVDFVLKKIEVWIQEYKAKRKIK